MKFVKESKYNTSMDKNMIAHINEHEDEQTIKDHLYGTADRAEKFASEFNCGDIGKFCGLLHDIGKFSKQFQKRIRDPQHIGKVDHSTAGAIEAIYIERSVGDHVGLPLAMAIAGHHSGLMDGGSQHISSSGDGTFFGRLKAKENLPDYSAWKNEIELNSVMLPEFCTNSSNAFVVSFFIRMIYSCLVDADYLDTEYFMKQGKTERTYIYLSIDELLKHYKAYINKWLYKKDFKSQEERQICESRNSILRNCMDKGVKSDRGLYTLTVPTGGGKTTASLGFALQHMKRNNMNRIIYVIPYTSIIDQNAAIFRKILGDENVLEHHSGISYEITEEDLLNSCDYKKILATENWDAPIIVTTSVQFFESLYANRNSQCRKLHNIANSIIIFDEVQTIPIPYLKPCVAALSELIAHYKSTVVLCTATQPFLDTLFHTYLPNYCVTEICDNIDILQKQFSRTTICNEGILIKSDLLCCLKNKKQILCIVNRRMMAQELFTELNNEGTYCLTTLLCPAERKKKILEIKKRLKDGLSCIVIATSLVEAGVDLDFPEVYRQETGLDSLIQSAGRCNREGKRNAEESVVHLFSLDGDTSKFIYKKKNALNETLRRYDNPTTLEAISFYFQFYRELVGDENLDQNNIIDSFLKGINGNCFPFRTVSDNFKLINEQTKTIYIPLGKGETLINELYKGNISKSLFRELGQYSVNVYPDHFKALYEAGCLEVMDETIYILRDMNQYNLDTGLRLDIETGDCIFI